MRVLGIKLAFSARASSACNSRAISPASHPSPYFLVLETEPRASHTPNNAASLNGVPNHEVFSFLSLFAYLLVCCVCLACEFWGWNLGLQAGPQVLSFMNILSSKNLAHFLIFKFKYINSN